MPPLITSPLPAVKTCCEFNCKTPLPALTTPPVLTILPVKFSEPPAITWKSRVPAPVAPADNSGTLRFSTPAIASTPPELSASCVRSGSAPVVNARLPPARSVKLFINTFALSVCKLESPTFCSVPAAVKVPTDESSSEVSKGRSPELPPLVRKPVPRPVEEVSPRMSGRILIV